MNKSRDTGLAITLILALLAVFLKHPFYLYGLIASLVLTMINPRWCAFFVPVWFGFSHLLGTIVSKVIFTSIFLLLATPIGLLRKIIGKDSLGLKKYGTKNATAFVTREETYTAEHLKTPY